MKKLFAFLLGAALLLPTISFAEDLTFKIRSYHKNSVELAFYSQNRNHEWPGNNKVYVIKDYEVHDYKLSCVKGEKICFGAWVQGAAKTYWGGGRGGKQACSSCCFTCNGGVTAVQNLNER